MTLWVSVTSAVAGLLISAQDWAQTATGATIVLVAFGWFLVSTVAAGKAPLAEILIKAYRFALTPIR